MASETRQEEESHALPPWFDKLQMLLMLPLLLVAEGVINGNMLALGIPADTPEHLFERSVMYVTGFLMGGMALRCSATAAQSFQRREIVFTLINVVGIGLFAIPEMWASLVVRGVNLPVTGPDNWLLGQLGVVGTQLTPSNVFVSVMLPLVTIFWGFATRKRTRLSTAELEEIERAKTIKAQGRKERAALNGGAVGATLGGVFNAAREQVTGKKAGDISDANPDGSVEQTPALRLLKAGGIDVTSESSRAGVLPTKGPWNKADIRAWLKSEYPHIRIAEPALVAAMKSEMGAFKDGTRLVADPRSVRPWARRFYGAPASESVEQVS